MHDIRTVCHMLGTTSRTLRFYEEKGLIGSAKAAPGARRQYTDEQIGQIRRIMALRALGLSVKTIGKLQREEGDLRRAVLERRAEILASIEAKQREIHLLTEALSALEAGEDLFSDAPDPTHTPAEEEAIAAQCARAIVEGDTAALYGHLGAKLRAYMPPEVYETVRTDTLEPLGEFVCHLHTEHDDDYPHILYAYVRYTRLGLKIKFVFRRGTIEGLWMGYFDEAQGGKS